MEAANEGFKIPSTIPQDLLLIQDLIGIGDAGASGKPHVNQILS
jgi:hypothetical protein